MFRYYSYCRCFCNRSRIRFLWWVCPTNPALNHWCNQTVMVHMMYHGWFIQINFESINCIFFTGLFSAATEKRGKLQKKTKTKPKNPHNVIKWWTFPKVCIPLGLPYNIKKKTQHCTNLRKLTQLVQTQSWSAISRFISRFVMISGISKTKKLAWEDFFNNYAWVLFVR